MALLIISVMITVSLSTPVNKTVDSINGQTLKTVTITFLGKSDPELPAEVVRIADNFENAPRNAFRYIHSALYNSDIRYERTQDNSGNIILLFDTDKNAGKSFSFDCPNFSNTSFNLIADIDGGKVKVDCGSFSREYDLYSDNGASVVRCMPICESYSNLIPYFLIYIATFVLIVFAVYVSEKYVLRKLGRYIVTHRDDKWIKYNMKLDVIIIFAALSAFSLISLYTGAIPRFLEGGDQNDYWYRISDLGNSEEFNSIYDIRGYLCYWGPAFCRYVGEFFGGMDPAAIWVICMNLFAAGLLGITFPMLGKKLYGYSLTRPQVYFSVPVMCVLWRTLFVYVLMDLPAAVFFISAFTIYIYFLEKPSAAKGVFCGAFFAIASNLKVNYQYVSIALVAVWTIFFFVKKGKYIKRLSEKAKKQIISKMFNVRSVSSAIVIVLAFVAVCIPQLVINMSKGVTALTPYETEASYAVLAAEDENYLVVELGASRTFTYTRLYPSGSPADSQVQGIMSDYTGNTSSLLKYPQLFEMFLRKPIDTLIMMMKKIILGMNVLDSSPYNPDYTGYRNSLMWLKCLLNYIVLFGGIYAVFRKHGNVKDKLIFICMFLLCILPNTLSQVEWRYFIVGYLFADFYFCYSFMPYCAVKSNKDTECPGLNGFYKGLSFFLPVMAIICATIT